MSDDYLWDRSGEPDEEIARLENVMGRLRSRREAPDFAPPPIAVVAPRRRARALAWRWAALGAAAAVAIVVLARLLVPGPRAWTVTGLEGSPLVGGTPVAGRARLAAGEWVETKAQDRARLDIRSVGEVELEPRTRLRLLRVSSGEHRFALEQGTMHALIWAPPRRFLVETPSAIATDLGCTYTLRVDRAGAGELQVTSGWVAFQHARLESFVPAGAICRTRPGHGPGTPFYQDAPPPLALALERFDFGDLPADLRAQSLATALSAARRRDAFTLWHLISRAPPEQRRLVVDALAARIPAPSNRVLAGALAGDRAALDLWWNELGLGDADWWRMWEGRWPGKS